MMKRRNNSRGVWRLLTATAAAFLLANGACLLGLPARASAAPEIPPGATVVSLTFDDGFSSQYAASRVMAEHGMAGTFYVPSGFIGREGRLTLAQIQSMQEAGNEIGGHTLNHLHLPILDPDEQARQICDDRVDLSREGLRVTSFAYPFAAMDARTEQIVKRCGYNSARAEEGLSEEGSCADCPFGESVPPADPFALRTGTPVSPPLRLSSIEQQITDARVHGGGWVPIVFHEICDHCSDMAFGEADFAALLTWLGEQAANGVVVKTVNDVVGGDVQTLVNGPPTAVRPPGQLVNPSLEAADSRDERRRPDVSGQSECWTRSGYGTNTSTWARVPSSHSGGWAEQVSVSSRSSGDQKLIIEQDTGSCAPEVKPGQRYTLSAWYTSTVGTRFVVFVRNAQGSWRYWTQSPSADASGDWTQFSWQTPPVPEGADRMSFGLQLAEVGTLTTDDYAMRLVPDAPPVWPIVGAVLAFVALAPTIGYVVWIRVRRLPRRLGWGGA